MNQIRLEGFNNLGSFHFGQINGQTNVIVQWKGKALCVSNGVTQEFFGQLLGWRLGIDGQNIDIVPGFGHEFEHFLEAIGIARHVSKGCGFHH